MAATQQRESISLYGAADPESTRLGHASAFLIKLDDSTVQDLRKASRDKDAIRFLTGATPKLRIGTQTIDLIISADAYRTELFASTLARPRDFNFSSIITHRIELQHARRTSDHSTSGTDAALAALQSNLASYEQEKQANRTNFTNSILPAPKNRFDAARKEKAVKKNNLLGSLITSPSLNAVGTPRIGPAPTSAPVSEDDARLQAMRMVLVHLLATEPATNESIAKKTRIPKSDLDGILGRCGKQIDGKWQLSDRAYRELDVWKFEYPSQESRKLAIDNAVKAYDRMRLGKEEQLWQMLLPKEERGKGKVLSRLHLGTAHVNRGLTPNYQPSPTPQLDAMNESRVVSAANTPRSGATTPRPASSKGDVMKRLLSKDPKRARAAEDVKEKKRKERETAATDREGGRPAKKRATQTNQPNVKSAEFVHSSDEDSSDEVPIIRQSKSSQVTSVKPKPRERTTAAPSPSSDSSDALRDGKVGTKAAVPAKANPTTNKHTASPALTTTRSTVFPASKPTKTAPAGKATPQPNSTLSAPSSQHKSQRSPQKQDTRPSVPSPLGPSRPRGDSDISERSTTRVQKARDGGTGTLKGLGITKGMGKPKAKNTPNLPSIGNQPKDDHAPSEQQKPHANGLDKPITPTNNGTSQPAQNGVKRKAEQAPSRDTASGPSVKHRKTNSTSSQSQNHSSDSSMAKSDTPRTSPDGPIDGSGSDSAASVIDTITYNQGVAIGDRFNGNYYPAYEKLYDEQAAMEARGERVSIEERKRLLQMHARVEQMKREMNAASEREGRDE